MRSSMASQSKEAHAYLIWVHKSYRGNSIWIRLGKLLPKPHCTVGERPGRYVYIMVKIHAVAQLRLQATAQLRLQATLKLSSAETPSYAEAKFSWDSKLALTDTSHLQVLQMLTPIFMSNRYPLRASNRRGLGVGKLRQAVTLTILSPPITGQLLRRSLRCFSWL